MTRYIAGRDRCEVFLDGEPCADVVECDDELGFVIRCKRTDEGRIALNESCDRMLTEIVLGNVIVARTITRGFRKVRGKR